MLIAATNKVKIIEKCYMLSQVLCINLHWVCCNCLNRMIFEKRRWKVLLIFKSIYYFRLQISADVSVNLKTTDSIWDISWLVGPEMTQRPEMCYWFSISARSENDNFMYFSKLSWIKLQHNLWKFMKILSAKTIVC